MAGHFRIACSEEILLLLQILKSLVLNILNEQSRVDLLIFKEEFDWRIFFVLFFTVNCRLKQWTVRLIVFFLRIVLSHLIR